MVNIPEGQTFSARDVVKFIYEIAVPPMLPYQTGNHIEQEIHECQVHEHRVAA
jgi:hypothetical protein